MYWANWKFSIRKEDFFHSQLNILLFDQQSFYIYDLCRYSPFDFYKSPEYKFLKVYT